MSPYFVPPPEVIAALQLAAPRGVDVRILLLLKPDHRLVYLASFYYLRELNMNGIRFFRYEPGFLHQKALLIDDDLAAVGTANADNRSFSLNFELMMYVVEPEFVKSVERMLDDDFAQSRPVPSDELDRRGRLPSASPSTSRACCRRCCEREDGYSNLRTQGKRGMGLMRKAGSGNGGGWA
ncbi:MAG: phospholipase D-like domain-containing protein [Kiritimatiellia bacterium]